MARNGSGTYTLAEAAFVADTIIDEAAVNSNFSDIAAQITNSVATDGQTTMSGNLKLGTNKVTGGAVGTLQDDMPTLRQVQANAYGYVASDTGSADAYAIAPSPAIAAYVAGQRFSFIATNASTGASTVDVNGLGTKAIQLHGSALAGAEIGAGDLVTVMYDGTQFQIQSPVGDVTGPASATDNSLARFDGTTGKLLKDGAVIGTDVLANLSEDTSPQLGGDLDANGSQIQWSKGADVVCANALPLLTDGNYFDITTGVDTVTSINTTGGAGTVVKVHCDVAILWTHHATNLILPGGANIQGAAGDEVEFIEYGAGTYRCTAYTKADGTAVAGSSLPKNYITGLALTNDTDTAHDISVAAGECRGSDDDEDISLTSAMVKRIDASWASGTGNGGLSSSLTLADATWYHVHAIMVGGSADVGFDTSITAANLVADHSATAYRRIGSVLTFDSGGSNYDIAQFTQIDDMFFWDTAITEYNADPGTTEQDITLTVPTGLKILADLSTWAVHGLGDNVDMSIKIYSSDISTPGFTYYMDNVAGNQTPGNGGRGLFPTNTSAQVKAIMGSLNQSNMTMVCHGYRDTRGRNA